jgi:hypothetical protein
LPQEASDVKGDLDGAPLATSVAASSEEVSLHKVFSNRALAASVAHAASGIAQAQVPEESPQLVNGLRTEIYPLFVAPDVQAKAILPDQPGSGGDDRYTETSGHSRGRRRGFRLEQHRFSVQAGCLAGVSGSVTTPRSI